MFGVSKSIRRSLRKQYPAIVNGTAGPLTTFLANRWLESHPAERQELNKLELLQLEIRKQPEYTFSPIVLQCIQRRLNVESPATIAKTVRWQVWLIPLLLLLLTALLLQLTLPPVVQVNWSVPGQDVGLFRVYRISNDHIDDISKDDGKLIYEIVANQSKDSYGFIDPVLFPDSDVIYRIEAISPNGLMAASVTRVADGATAFIGQILLIIIAILFSYVLWLVGRERIVNRRRLHYDLA